MCFGGYAYWVTMNHIDMTSLTDEELKASSILNMPMFGAAIGRNGVVVILFVQIYNWFPLKDLPWILSILWVF